MRLENEAEQWFFCGRSGVDGCRAGSVGRFFGLFINPERPAGKSRKEGQVSMQNKRVYIRTFRYRKKEKPFSSCAGLVLSPHG
ncbi:hypothetical protein, partial [Brevibacillus agri]|uniref:hypothetical protein n=1 Tax=Brevibacillus agri TaxID=51101 RepID=UPI002E1A292B|nr:hypothetical protein [Brevibacillus agri]